MNRAVCQSSARRTRKRLRGRLARVRRVSGTIGVRRRRGDGEAKVRGTTRYAADLPVPDILHARLVLSSEAHARIAGIDTEAARAVPGRAAALAGGGAP